MHNWGDRESKPRVFISQDGNRTRTPHYGARDFKSRASAYFATWPENSIGDHHPLQTHNIRRRLPNSWEGYSSSTDVKTDRGTFLTCDRCLLSFNLKFWIPFFNGPSGQDALRDKKEKSDQRRGFRDRGFLVKRNLRVFFGGNFTWTIVAQRVPF